MDSFLPFDPLPRVSRIGVKKNRAERLVSMRRIEKHFQTGKENDRGFADQDLLPYPQAYHYGIPQMETVPEREVNRISPDRSE